VPGIVGVRHGFPKGVYNSDGTWDHIGQFLEGMTDEFVVQEILRIKVVKEFVVDVTLSLDLQNRESPIM
jgi:hypothetical protein